MYFGQTPPLSAPNDEDRLSKGLSCAGSRFQPDAAFRDSVKRKVVPSPGTDSTQIRPP
jgi:hypothetical protein